VKIDMTSFFYAEGGPMWIKFRRLSTAVIWPKSKRDVEFQYGGRLGEFNGMSSRATCHIAWCCHLANLMPWSQSYVSHCRVLQLGEFNGMSTQSHVSHCRVLPVVNSLLWFHSHMPHCRVQSPGEINVMIVPHCSSAAEEERTGCQRP